MLFMFINQVCFHQFKVAFDQMIALIPSLQEDRHGRTSKALVLQKGNPFIFYIFLFRIDR